MFHGEMRERKFTKKRNYRVNLIKFYIANWELIYRVSSRYKIDKLI